MTTQPTTIGPKMQRALDIVARGPIARIDLAREVGPNGSLQYGYAVVSRLLRAGLVRLAPALPGRCGATIVMAD